MKTIVLIKRITSSFVVLLFVIQLSNGRVLVGNETDNMHQTQKKETCRFTCDFGACLEEKFLCDGKADCVDGSDEALAYCAKLRRVTRANECSSESQSSSISSSGSAGKTINKTLRKVTTNCVTPNSGSNIVHNYKVTANLSDIVNAAELSKLADSANSDGTVQLPSNFIQRLLCDDKTVRELGLDVCAILDPSQLVANTKITINNVEQLPQDLCSFDDPNKFRCDNAKCIPKTARCDGAPDCADGSDEVGCPSTAVVQPSEPPPSRGCLLPVHVPNGKYQLSSGSPYSENAVVDSSSIINLSCDVGYAATEIRNFFCSKNIWVPDLKKSHCRRTCPALSSTDTFDASCKFRGQSVNCDTAEDGTVATISCKPYYVYRGTRSKVVCRSNGQWDPYPTECEPECGRKIVNAQTFVIGGSDSLQGEYPWIAGIYNTSVEQKKYICAGSIISRLYILSAGHCFTDKNGTPYPEDYFTIAAGKYHRALDYNENDIQLRKARKLYVHKDFRGILHKYRDDIALIKVDKLEMTATVQLICLDWQNRYENTDLRENKQGVVAGWGFTQEGAAPAEVLKKLIVPFRSEEVCRQNMDPSFFEQYFASDKICAGYIDQGMSVCSGDSGGGLYFESHPATFYVRGIVSLSPRSKTGCSSNQYALYTKVSKYILWIEEFTLGIL